MITFQGMRMRTEYMVESIRLDAIRSTLDDWTKAAENYYRAGYDHGETARLYRELEDLGADMDAIFALDLEIRDRICGC